MPDIKKYLNRDGLDEYNSLLPHSSAEMQTYVNDWLDDHPEASTTVQDGAITEPKLADKSVSLRTLADDTVHMLKGMILTQEISGKVLMADDAYSAPPMAFTVEGKSTQDGTPTPDAPVEIVSLEQVNLGFYGRNLLDPSTLSNGYISSDGSVYGSTDMYKHNNYLRAFPGITYRVSQGGAAFNQIRTAFYDENKRFIYSYSQNQQVAPTFTAPENAAYMRSSFHGAQVAQAMIEVDRGTYEGFVSYSMQSVLLNLTQALRSLPDGTHDTLSFAYLRPSTREGWAWYTPTRTVNVGEFLATSPNGWFKSSSATNGYYKMVSSITDNRGALNTRNGIMVPWFKAANSVAEYYVTANSCWVDTYVNFNIDPTIFSGTATEFGAWVATHNIKFYMPLRTPTITVLDPIELPFTEAPDFTIWNDPSTGLQMEYVRDSNLVIQRIEQAIADQ